MVFVIWVAQVIPIWVAQVIPIVVSGVTHVPHAEEGEDFPFGVSHHLTSVGRSDILHLVTIVMAVVMLSNRTNSPHFPAWLYKGIPQGDKGSDGGGERGASPLRIQCHGMPLLRADDPRAGQLHAYADPLQGAVPPSSRR